MEKIMKKKIGAMTKSEMIQELAAGYQYPINGNRSAAFIRKILGGMRKR